MKKEIRIGRHSKNDIVINDPHVGKSVLAIMVDHDGDCYAEDLKSTNGVWINNKRIYGKVKLHPDDEVRIGNTTLPWKKYVKEMNYEFRQCINGHYYQGDECPYCKVDKFKLCLNGHYYQGETCPYCKAQAMPYDNIVEEPVQDLGHLKTCPNGHAYGPRLNYCPYCGETEVCGQIDLVTGWPGVLKFVFDMEIVVKINNNSEKTVSELEIGYLCGGGYNTYYGIVGLSDLNYKSIIQIGRHTFTGKEFIKWIDFMIGVKEIENHQ